MEWILSNNTDIDKFNYKKPEKELYILWSDNSRTRYVNVPSRVYEDMKVEVQQGKKPNEYTLLNKINKPRDFAKRIQEAYNINEIDFETRTY